VLATKFYFFMDLPQTHDPFHNVNQITQEHKSA